MFVFFLRISALDLDPDPTTKSNDKMKAKTRAMAGASLFEPRHCISH